MNKKLLLATMSLAAFAACTNDDFATKEVAQSSSPVQFELVNDAETRAQMLGNKIAWDVADGDLFTLYHGSSTSPYTSGYQNATYKAEKSGANGDATLTTPSMILEGRAVMVWPADTTFRITSSNDLTITIPAVQNNVVNNIPYMSDLINIGAYDGTTGSPNTAGKDRKYKICMRPMASQLIIEADYAGTDGTLAQLYGEDSDNKIKPIEVTSIELKAPNKPFTTEIPVVFNGSGAYWPSDGTHAWDAVTKLDVSSITPTGQAEQLTAKDACLLEGNTGAKFLVLPQTVIGADGVNNDGDANAAVVVNTTYGKVLVGSGSSYTPAESSTAWYRYVSEATNAKTSEGETPADSKSNYVDPDGNSKQGYKTTANVSMGMKQTFNALNKSTSPSGYTQGEPAGNATKRYVQVRLNYLDMSGLHIKTDKQLRDVARVWKKMGLSSVTVYLDGNETTGEFVMSQKTVDVINEANAVSPSKQFHVKPCTESEEACTTIKLVQKAETGVTTTTPEKITSHSLLFVEDNGGTKVRNLILSDETTPWVWDGSWLISENIVQITNQGTLINDANATIAAYTDLTPGHETRNTDIQFINAGKWNVTGGSLKSQIVVRNDGELNISKGAEFLEDSYNQTTKQKTFYNRASTKPSRFLADGDAESVGIVRNNGVFATIGKGQIHNYGGVIRHGMNDDDSMLTKDAMTFITSNQQGGNFANAFSSVPTYNRMGTIELPYANKDEENISISADASQGFVMVTTKDEAVIDMKSAGAYVNYLHVKGAATNLKMDVGNIKYIEFDADQQVVFEPGSTAYSFTGMMVLSNVNIMLGTTVEVTGAAYLHKDAKMYVAGKFNYGTTTNWNGYFGNTEANVATNYISFK